MRITEKTISPMYKANYAVFTAHKRTFMSLKDILEDGNLSCQARILFQIVSSLCVVKGYCFASNKYLCEKIKMSPSSLKRYLAELRHEQLITYVMVTTHHGQDRQIHLRYDKLRRRYLSNTPPKNKID